MNLKKFISGALVGAFVFGVGVVGVNTASAATFNNNKITIPHKTVPQGKIQKYGSRDDEKAKQRMEQERREREKMRAEQERRERERMEQEKMRNRNR